MRVNEFEISGVPDESPPAVQKTLKEKKGRKKPSLKEMVDDVPPISTTVYIKERDTSFSLSSSKNMSSFQFLKLYISSQHLDITWHININTKSYNISMIFLSSFFIFYIFPLLLLLYCLSFFFSLNLEESQV